MLVAAGDWPGHFLIWSEAVCTSAHYHQSDSGTSTGSGVFVDLVIVHETGVVRVLAVSARDWGREGTCSFWTRAWRGVTSEQSCSSSEVMERPVMAATVGVETSVIQSASWASSSRPTSSLLNAIRALDGGRWMAGAAGITHVEILGQIHGQCHPEVVGDV